MFLTRLEEIGLKIGAPDAEAAIRLLTRLTALAIAMTLVVSWPLWFNQRLVFDVYPLVNLPALPVWAESGLLFFVIATCGVLFFFPRYRRLCLIPPLVFIFWVLGDEFRWNPYMYMYNFSMLMIGLMPATATENNADSLRFMTIGIYFWAGIHKINTVFVFSIFPWFVSSWLPTSTAFTSLLALVVPFFELSIGLALLFPKTRRYGVLMASCMLFVVLASLMLHKWGMIVWLWNVCIYALAVVLFWNNDRPLLVRENIKRPFVALAIVLFCFMPGMGSFGAWGDLPSFKLYCGCLPNVRVLVDKEEDMSFLPDEVLQNDISTDIGANALAHGIFRVSAAASVAGSDMQKHHMRGMCKLLKYPERAQLEIETMPHIWSITSKKALYPLCDEVAAHDQ